jgi:septal ring factor EnvC (AmiA/AmiB activator)
MTEREEKSTINFEDLLEEFQTKRGMEIPQTEKKKSSSKGLPIATVILCIMIVALGIMVIIVKSDIAILKNDMTNLKNFKAQITTLDPKTQISSIESKFEDIKKEKETIKKEMDQLQADLEEIKTEPKNEKKKIQNKPKNRNRLTRDTIVKARNEELLLRKLTTKKIFFSDISRATNPDPPSK